MLDVPKVIDRQEHGPAYLREHGQSQLSLTTLLDVLWRRRLIVLVLAAVVVALGVAYLMVTPARYTSTTSLVIDTRRVQVVRDELVSENTVDQAVVESQVETIKSEKVALAVVKKLNLVEDPEFVGSAQGLIRAVTGAVGLKASPPMSDQAVVRRAVAVFRSGVKATRVGRSYVLNISFTSLDPGKAARIANEIGEAYIVDQLEGKFQAAQRASSWLHQRIGELREEASNAYRAVQDFKSENNIMDSSGKLNSDRELEELTSSLAKSRAETSQAQARLERIQSVLQGNGNSRSGLPDPAVTDALNNPIIVRLRQQYLDAQKQETDFAARFGRNHGAVVSLRNEMVGLQRAIWDEVQRIAETYKSDLAISRSREQSLEKRVTELFQQSSTTRNAQVKLRELETSSESYRQIHENFLNRYTQAVQQQSFPSTEARVITGASPGPKTSPRTGLTLVLSMMAGLGLGVAAAFAREHLDRVVRTRDQLERTLGVTILGVIPFAENRPPLASVIRSKLDEAPMIKSAQAQSRLVRGFLDRWLPVHAPRSEERRRHNRAVVLLKADEPFSIEAETLRSIKVAIDLDGIASDTRVVGIVSAVPGEGKTTIAASLAVMAAQSGRRTLLIDGDLRNPSLTKSLAPIQREGLLDVLSGRTTLEAAANPQLEHHFDFLAGPAAAKPVHTADILKSQAMKDLLEAARKNYDYVIVDLPPILPLVDVRASAHLFDGFVLVAEWGKTTIDHLEKALLSSSVLADRLLGVVLNKVDPTVMRRFEGYSGYNNGYYYGYGTDRS